MEKLEIALKSKPSEQQTVYVLTRIYKILEIDKKVCKYPVLKFYRDWCVHARIDYPKGFENHLKDFIQEKERRYIFLFHEELRSQFNRFIKDYSLPIVSNKIMDKLIFYLGKVISDTPVKVIQDNGCYELQLDEPPEIGESGSYKISVTVKVG